MLKSLTGIGFVSLFALTNVCALGSECVKGVTSFLGQAQIDHEGAALLAAANRDHFDFRRLAKIELDSLNHSAESRLNRATKRDDESRGNDSTEGSRLGLK